MSLNGLRMALIGPMPPPPGGMANQTEQLYKLLELEGADVTLVRSNAPYRPAWIGKVKGVRALARLFPFLLRLWRTAGRVELFHVMANSGWSWHLFAAPAIWIGSLRGVRVIVNYRGGLAEDFFSRSFRWVGPTLKMSHEIVVPSEFLETVFAKWGLDAAVLPNIIDLELFSPAESEDGPMDLENPELLIARALEPIYDVETAVRAFEIVRRELPGARMKVAGGGREGERLRELTREMGVEDAVTFVGLVENRKMPELYRTATLVVNPSLVDNMPISILEALASGVPVVSTNVGGVPVLVQDGRTASLVPPRNPDAMARAILAVLQDETRYRRMRRDGLSHVGRFSWQNVSEILSEVYLQVLERTGDSLEPRSA